MRRVRAALTPAEWRRSGALAAVVIGLHLVGFGLLLALVVPGHLSLGDGAVFGVGLGLTAYMLGMRHAFDADHIAAIDTTTRKLIAQGQRPLAVGFFFSLGHSTIVFVLAVALAAGVRGLSGAVEDEGSALHEVTGVIGPTVSGVFLLLLGLLNLVALLGIARILRRMRSGAYDDAELEEQLERRGLLNRIYGRATRAVSRSWHMYPVGVLFGLGFDTATEVALLATAGTAAAADLPLYAILCLPILFAAGMTLLDTLDGAFMNFAYGWALSHPIRKVFYNLTVTALSVLVALLIGTIQLVAVLSEQAGLAGQPWDFVAGVDLNHAGYAIFGVFLLVWVASMAAWRFGRIEERWQPAGKAPG